MPEPVSIGRTEGLEATDGLLGAMDDFAAASGVASGAVFTKDFGGASAGGVASAFIFSRI